MNLSTEQAFDLLHGDTVTKTGPAHTHTLTVSTSTMLSAWLDATPRWRWIVRRRLRKRLDEHNAATAES